MYKKDKKTNNNKILVFIALLAIFAIGLAVYFVSNSESNKPVEDSQVNEINYNPPTEDEQNAGDIQKEEIVEDNDSTPPTPSGAEVIIVDASQYEEEIEVRAFVSNIIRNGTCTITFTKAELEIKKEVPAYADASTTPCITLTVPRAEFSSAGSWSVEVTYTNGEIMGTSKGTISIE